MNGATVDHNPLTKDHLDALNQALILNEKAQRNIDRLRQSGVDVEQAAMENATLKNYLVGLKSNFFPGYP